MCVILLLTLYVRNQRIFQGKAKSCFRDSFLVVLISRLFGNYANINMWKSDHMKAFNCIKSDCGRFVKNRRYQETGKEYFTMVQMIVKDEGY